jgi:hypothetical protein
MVQALWNGMLAILAMPPGEIEQASCGIAPRKPMGGLRPGKKKFASGLHRHRKIALPAVNRRLSIL